MTRSDIIYLVNYAVSDEEKKLQRISYTSLKKEKKKEEAKYRVTHLTNDLSL